MSVDAKRLSQSLGLRSRLPPEKPFISLSHAISWVALRRSISGPTLSKLIGIGKQQCHERIDRNRLLDEAIKSAVEKLTDLGLSGEIEFLGREYDHVRADDRNNEIPTERIPTQRLADYRGFDTLDDTLFPEPYREVKLAWCRQRTEIGSPLEKHYRFVLVKRADLMRHFYPIVPQPFTDLERKAWIVAQPQQSADNAHKAFKAHPCFDGTKQKEFRKEWKTTRETRVGRPRKSREKGVLTI